MTRLQVVLSWMTLSAVLMVLVPSRTFGQSTLTGPISSAQDAAIRAFAYGGFDEYVTYTKLPDDQIQVVQLIDTTTPFLHRFSNCESVWRVHFDGVRFGEKTDNDSTAVGRRSFTVFIDSITSHLLKIEGVFAPFDSTITPVITAQDAEEQIEGRGEQYVRIPDNLPVHSFMDIFGTGPSYPSQARRVVAQYVAYSRSYTKLPDSSHVITDPKLCWVVSSEGIPPMEPTGGPADWLPVYTRNRIRQVINATTGRMWISSTAPSVRISDADKRRIFPNGF